MSFKESKYNTMKYLVETKLISNVVLNYLFTKLLSSAEKNLFTLQSYQLKKMGLPLKITKATKKNKGVASSSRCALAEHCHSENWVFHYCRNLKNPESSFKWTHLSMSQFLE